MDPIRRKRVHTYRKKNKKLAAAGKATAFWYMSVFAAATLVTPTLAQFSTGQSLEGNIQAGKWPVPWKQTDMELISASDEIESCEPVNVKATFANKGTYETEPGHWVVVGKPGTHSIQKLQPGEKVELSFKADEPGTYTFKAYQDGEHPSELKKKVNIVCEKEEEEEKEKPEDTIEEKVEQEQPKAERPEDTEQKPEEPEPESNEQKDKGQPETPIPQPPAEMPKEPASVPSNPVQPPVTPQEQPKESQSKPAAEQPAVKESNPNPEGGEAK